MSTAAASSTSTAAWWCTRNSPTAGSIGCGDGAPAEPITPPGAFRYGDLRLHLDRHLVLAVREDHGGDDEPVNTIVALDLDGDNADGGVVLCAGADFYSSPELSGRDRLAWTEWNHPDLPWDSTMIKMGTLAGGRLSEVSEVAGGPGESAVAPRWLGEELIFVSDRTDWWNLYLWSDGSIRALHETDAEFCLPQWQLGQTPYAVLDHDQLLCSLEPGRGAEPGGARGLEWRADAGARAPGRGLQPRGR